MMVAKASLTYEHKVEWLRGTIGMTSISMPAASGGHRASIDKKGLPRNKGLQPVARRTFNPMQPGAAIPKGTYRLAFLGEPYITPKGVKHPKGAVLMWPSDEIRDALVGHRSSKDFLIHGPGPLGSEGCIVLYKKQDYQALMKVFKDSYGTVVWSKADPWHGTLEILDEPLDAWKNHILRVTDPHRTEAT